MLQTLDKTNHLTDLCLVQENSKCKALTIMELHSLIKIESNKSILSKWANFEGELLQPKSKPFNYLGLLLQYFLLLLVLATFC